MNTFKIIHHASCFDGVAGAWVAIQYTTIQGADSAEILPCTYDERDKFDLSKFNEDDTVIIVDFSFPAEKLNEMASKVRKVILIDHHKTARADLEGQVFLSNVEIHFDMERSGAGLAWDVLFPKLQRPQLIDLIEDRDLWRFKYPQTKPVIAYLASHPLDIIEFDKVVNKTMGSVIQSGMAILDYIDTFGDKICETWTINRIAGFDVPTINTPYMNSSDHIEKLMQKLPGHPFYAYYFCKAGNIWQFGLRSRGDFDVSDVARMYGGGGHKNAAGFTLKHLPWTVPFMTGHN